MDGCRSGECRATHVVRDDDAATEQRDDAGDTQELAAEVRQVRQHADQRHLCMRTGSKLAGGAVQVTAARGAFAHRQLSRSGSDGIRAKQTHNQRETTSLIEGLGSAIIN